jgi:hypothetical protein
MKRDCENGKEEKTRLFTTVKRWYRTSQKLEQKNAPERAKLDLKRTLYSIQICYFVRICSTVRRSSSRVFIKPVLDLFFREICVTHLLCIQCNPFCGNSRHSFKNKRAEWNLGFIISVNDHSSKNTRKIIILFELR